MKEVHKDDCQLPASKPDSSSTKSRWVLNAANKQTCNPFHNLLEDFAKTKPRGDTYKFKESGLNKIVPCRVRY